MNYQEHLNYIVNNPNYNIQKYLEKQIQNNPSFSWFEITPELKTHDGEDTCLFYKLIFEDFTLASKYMLDFARSSEENQGKSFEESNLFSIQTSMAIHPLNPENLITQLTPTKKTKHYLTIDIMNYSEDEFFIKTFLAKALINPSLDDSYSLSQKNLYDTLSKMSDIVLSQSQKDLVDETMMKIESLGDKRDKQVIIDYLNSSKLLPINNEMTQIALLKPVLKFFLIKFVITTDDKKEIAIKTKNSILFSSINEMIDILTLIQTKEPTSTSPNDLFIIEAQNFSNLPKKLISFINLVKLNEGALVNQIQFEKDWFEKILENKEPQSKKQKL